MSSTNRGSQKPAHEYYSTPVPEIIKFLKAWREDLEAAGHELPSTILDPCCGGNMEPVELMLKKKGVLVPVTLPKTLAPYPVAFSSIPHWNTSVYSLDIRPDANAQYCGDYLHPATLQGFPKFDAIISNPPFSKAMEFILKALRDVKPGGYVAMLCRLNFLASEERNKFMRETSPTWIYGHGKRMSFTPDGQTDSIDYCHFVYWQGHYPKHSKLRVLEY